MDNLYSIFSTVPFSRGGRGFESDIFVTYGFVFNLKDLSSPLRSAFGCTSFHSVEFKWSSSSCFEFCR